MIPDRKPTDQTIVRPAGFAPNLSSMDVPRTGVAAKKRKRRIMIIVASVLGLILATIAISRLKPAVPSVDRSTVWVDTVKRGPMVRQVRGLGHACTGRHSLDSGKHRRTGGKNKYLAWDTRGIGLGDFGINQS